MFYAKIKREIGSFLFVLVQTELLSLLFDFLFTHFNQFKKKILFEKWNLKIKQTNK